MEVLEGIGQFEPPGSGVVLTIGNFDGVHIGHRRILARARELGRPVVAITFDPHPLDILKPERAAARLTTRAEKLALLRACGADCTIVWHSDRTLLSKTAEEFLREVVQRCRPRAFVEGQSFNFGRERAGSNETLRAHADRYGYAVHVVPTQLCESLPASPIVNSSAIRQALRAGRIDVANAMLGRPHRLTGTVGSDNRRGGSLGFPTANLNDVPHLLPQEAVYAGVAELESGELHLAAINIGRQPTFANGMRPRIEAHLLNFAGELHGQRLGLHLLERLRGQVKFANVDELTAQLHRDVAVTRSHAKTLESLRDDPRLPL